MWIRRSEPDSAMQQSPGEIPRVIHGDSLLNTKEAARFLRVSEASIRRWSDAGLLPARRVGRRRERLEARNPRRPTSTWLRRRSSSVACRFLSEATSRPFLALTKAA